MTAKELVIFFLNIVHLHSQLSSLNLPSYFVVDYYTADGFNGKPRQMQPIWYNNIQIVYVGASDGVHALIDSDGDGTIRSSEDHLIWNDFTAQSRSFDIEISSIAFSFDGTAFYVTLWEITKKCIPDNPYSTIHQQILATKSMSCNPWFSSTAYSSHSWHYTEIDPSTNKLCISFGNNGNMPSTNYPNDSPTDVPQRTISCFNDMTNPTTTNMRIRAQGLRHSVGFTFNTNNNNQLWFTDHNRDNFNKVNNNYDYINFTDGELNKVSYDGEHFGFPWCHSTGTGSPYLRDYGVASFILDSDDPWNSQLVTQCKDSNFTKPVQALGPHVAPDGVKFYSGYSMTNWPLKYLNSLFVAEHGSWNRPQKIGYRVVSIILDSNDDVTEHNVFVDGWLTNSNSYWGRPVDIAVLNDGSILISEDNPGSIIRIYYDPPTLAPTNNPSINPTMTPTTDTPTRQPSTSQPTTGTPTTDTPTTEKPTTATPTNQPSTSEPTTDIPTTDTPTTNAPNTATPGGELTTNEPTTMEPTTASPTDYILVSDITNNSKTNIYRLNVMILIVSVICYAFYAF